VEQPSVIQLLARVMNDVRAVGKSDTNSHFKFQFRGIDTVLDAVGPALRTHGVVVIPELREQTSEIVGGKSVRVIVKVAYTFYGPAGDHITAVVPGEAMDAQDKASSKAMSVAFRTALIQALAIPTGERDPHAGAPVGRKRIQLMKKLETAAPAKDLNSWAELRDDYALWSEGAEFEAATDKDLEDYLKHLDPSATTRMQRSPNGAQS
jgi:ERF superfamily protein